MLPIVVEIGIGKETIVATSLVDVATDTGLAVSVVGIPDELVPELFAYLGVEPSSLGERGVELEEGILLIVTLRARCEETVFPASVVSIPSVNRPNQRIASIGIPRSGK